MKKEKGITMVSLVITIIILIILAGVSLNMTIGEDGLITKAKQAKENATLASEAEEKQLNRLYEELATGGQDSNNSSGDEATIIALRKQIEEQNKTISSLQSQLSVLQSQSSILQNKYDLLETDFTKLRNSVLQILQDRNINIDNQASVDTIIENLPYVVAGKPISFLTSSATISTGQTITPFSNNISARVTNIYIYVSVGNKDAIKTSNVSVTLQASTDNSTWDTLKTDTVVRPTRSTKLIYDEFISIQKDYHYFRLTVHSDDNENSNLFKILYM